MVDIHTHILAGLDDGSGSLDESVAMLRMAAGDGTTDIVATPHANNQYTYQPGVVDAKIAELAAAAGPSIHIHRGCDFHLSYDNIQDALASPSKYSINGRGYLLVEFSDLLIPKTTEDVFFQMSQAGLTPIVTHPERNPLLQQRLERLAAWVEAGCLMQVTALSFLGRFGRAAKSFADDLLQRNLVHVVASDAHDTRHRPPLLREAFEYVRKARGEAVARALFVDNPRATLTGEPIAPLAAIAPAPAKAFDLG
ncbi:MAG: tyrosine-protein phosphatase, partial [Bryobacteraceae bacterium]